MDLQLSLKKILKKGSLNSELEFQRASVIDRQLRLLVKDYPELVDDRKQLRSILKAYEDQHWTDSELTDKQIEESDLAAQIAAKENTFNLIRKQVIKSRLREKGLAQKQLGTILGHTSETYISELINGINPFTLNDLILIHMLLDIRMELLVPTTLSTQIIVKVRNAVSRLNNPRLKLEIQDLLEV